MAPHRLTTARRYKVSTDVLILILQNLDPASLWKICKAFGRVYTIVVEYQPLRYKIELELAGMMDGPTISNGSCLGRLQLLSAYRIDWPKLNWSHEMKLPIRNPAMVGLTERFIHQIRMDNGNPTMELIELPSCRTGRPPALTRHLRFNTPQIDTVTTDYSQALLAMTHATNHNGQSNLRLYLCDLWTFAKHPRAGRVRQDFPLEAPVERADAKICGNKIAISFMFAGGRVQQFLVNWVTSAAIRVELKDVYFLSENYLLAIKLSHGVPVLDLHDITQLENICIKREYELPPTWRKPSLVDFRPNTAPLKEVSSTSDAIFYPNPACRSLMVNARLEDKSRNWLVINESYFLNASRREPQIVPWSRWGQHCLIREIPAGSSIRGPQLNGTRALYLDADAGHKGGCLVRMNVIDFSPHQDANTRISRAWTWVGKQAPFLPVEASREVPPSIGDCFKVQDIRITEDNIVLFHEVRHDIRPITILTFGASSARPPRHTPQL
ncbi:hypothetical protein BD779DRAFT_1468535 [Infundibulicybe gibba]|nr:hypothetical protein BD779DRAFT_1468535 [Infundibulicybe gibba]